MSPQAIVFLGPTLPVADARAILEADYRPPAAQGDLLRAAQERPAAIGLIDGLFERVPSVWHKEILWALSEGIRVYGAARVGALRAVECAPYGMIGVGRIYAAYRDGIFTDDDDVAVAHATAEEEYRPLSEALASLRLNWMQAERERVISARGRQILEGAAKRLFYPERTVKRVLQRARADGLDGEALDAVRTWWRHAQDYKRDDALELLRLMRAHESAPPPPLKPVTFEETTWWREAVARQRAYTP